MLALTCVLSVVILEHVLHSCIHCSRASCACMRASTLRTCTYIRVPFQFQFQFRHFRKDKARQSSYSKTWIMPYYIMFILTCHIVRGRVV